MDDSDLAANVRAFNRFYTEAIGSLDEDHEGLDITLAQARVLFSVSAMEPCSVNDIADKLRLDLADKEMLIYFMAIDACKFRRNVIPGDVLEMNLTTLRGKPGGKVWKFAGRATVEGDLAAEAEFSAMMDLPKA